MDNKFEIGLEKRKETLFKDTATARQYLQSGNIPAIIDLSTSAKEDLPTLGLTPDFLASPG